MPVTPPSIPIERLQRADQRLGRVACVLLQPLRWARLWRRRASAPRKMLLIKFWGIGSLQLLTPAVLRLRAAHGQARIELLTLKENEAFARGLGVFDEVRTIDVAAGGFAAILWRILRLVRALRLEHYDRVYDFEFFTRFSAVVSALSGAPHTAGFAAPSIWRGGFHTETVPFNRYWHVARNFRALADGENGQEVQPAEISPLHLEPESVQRVEELLESFGVCPGEDYVVLNPNAGRLSLERRWPATNFAQLATRLHEEEGVHVVFVGAPSEQEYVTRIARAAYEVPIINLAGELSVQELCCLLDRASAVCSNDSGPMHLSAALGTPTVGLFGPETPVMYAPLGRRTLALWDPPVCSPCINVHDNKVANCVRGFPECLTNLSVERVHSALQRIADDQVLIPLPAQRQAPTRDAPQKLYGAG